MDFKNIILELRDNIAILFLNRPNKLNAFTIPMMEEIISALDKIESEDEIKAVVLSGKGRVFCAGADLKERSDMNEQESIETVDRYRKLFKKIENLFY